MSKTDYQLLHQKVCQRISEMKTNTLYVSRDLAFFFEDNRKVLVFVTEILWQTFWCNNWRSDFEVVKILSYYKLISGLAVYDIIFILGMFTTRSMPSWPVSAIKIIYPVMYPIVHISYTGSIFMIVLVSFERYVSVCHMREVPIKRWGGRGTRYNIPYSRE